MKKLFIFIILSGYGVLVHANPIINCTVTQTIGNLNSEHPPKPGDQIGINTGYASYDSFRFSSGHILSGGGNDFFRQPYNPNDRVITYISKFQYDLKEIWTILSLTFTSGFDVTGSILNQTRENPEPWKPGPWKVQGQAQLACKATPIQ